ncbi:hypothetical protein [Myxococcus qinghaiensis]|uniref:hypothetical protein n=1 Tax=Myxococcus qinghaiensis TaxID=2906758 RepID=UPI0020A778C7|nr:hypothetical protein [Myxococcus qinghaiensis]MCP3165140.1 hypothetical protein [Myxococcus qinghaiensis]
MMQRTRAVVVWVGLLAGMSCSDDGAKDDGAGDALGPVPPTSGVFRWYADITPGAATGDAFAVGADGRVALAASPFREGTVAGVPFAHYGPGTTIPNYDLLVAVLDSKGALAWKRSFSTVEIEAANAVAFDEAGDVYLAGLLKDNHDGLDFGDGVTVGIGRGEISSFLVKLRGADGKALWAMGIVSGEQRYVQPYCGLFRKELQVRGGLGAIGCVFSVSDLSLGRVRLVTSAGTTEVSPVALGANGFVLAFDPANGRPLGTYVMGGAEAVIRTLALTESGGVVLGGRLRTGTVVDSAGSEPLVLAAPSCLIAALGADLRPVHRRVLGGGVDTDCEPGDVALGENGRVHVGGNAEGDVGLGDGVTGQGAFGFSGVLNADLSNEGTFERFANEWVFGVATDAWGQSFTGVSRESASPVSLRYTKRDAAGAVVHTSRTYTGPVGVRAPYLRVRGIGVDMSGAPTLFGVFSGPFSFDDGPHGNATEQSSFAVRFAP